MSSLLKKFYPFFTILVFFYWGCEDSVNEDTTPPTVSIQSPITNQAVNEMVTIIVNANDNKGIDRVEFYIDDSLFFTDIESPYQYEWNTTIFENNSEHTIKVICYDNSGNFTISQLVYVQIDNAALFFTQVYGGDEFDYGYSVQQTTDEGYIITGGTNSFGGDDSDIWLIKTDSQGDEEWNQVFGGDDYDIGMSVKHTADGGYIITGTTSSYGNTGSDIWLIKTDSQGNEEWNQTYGGTSSDYGYSVQQTTDEGYIITGYTMSYGSGGLDVWLIKTDSQGNEEWNKVYGGTYDDAGHSVQQTADEGYIITGITKSYGGGGSDVWLIKTDSQGNEEWNKTFGGNALDAGSSVQQTTDGGYIITGYTGSWGFGGAKAWLIKTDSQGNEEWNREFGRNGDSAAEHIQQTIDGGYILSGGTYTPGSDWDTWLIKTDSQGNEEWNQIYGGTVYDFSYSVQQTTDGGYIITGNTYSYGSGSSDIWLFKTDPEGNMETR